MEENMKNKLLIFVITIFGILMTACGAGDIRENNALNESGTANVNSTISDENYENNLHGLTQYLLDNEYISGEVTKMSAGIIGAQDGYKYEFKYNRFGVAVELYEYDLNNLNDKAISIIDQINQNGKFTIQNIEVPAIMSKNGKYMMVYKTYSNSDNSLKRKDEVTNAFLNFKA